MHDILKIHYTCFREIITLVAIAIYTKLWVRIWRQNLSMPKVAVSLCQELITQGALESGRLKSLQTNEAFIGGRDDPQKDLILDYFYFWNFMGYLLYIRWTNMTQLQEYIWFIGGDLNSFQDIWSLSVQERPGPPPSLMTFLPFDAPWHKKQEYIVYMV